MVVLGADGAGKGTLLRQAELLDSPLDDEQRAVWTEEIRQYVARLRAESAGSGPGHPADYFLREDTVSRIAAVDYLPTAADIVRLPPATAHPPVQTYVSALMRDARLTVLRARAGQPRKWRMQLEECHAILWVVDLMSYCRTVRDADTGESVNALVHDMRQLQDLLLDNHLRHVPIIVMLNKSDLFTSLPPASFAFRAHFPDHDGPDTPAGALRHLAQRYRAVCAVARRTRAADEYLHVCSAVDGDAMRLVFDAVRDSLVRSRLYAPVCF
ncbi:G-protein subunit alpha 7 [Mycena indigotica]|uniref:G-protein subunit alpha 7 n=1 Tax=Mycena indigotica TaxID=2126181 RepID=A0A8H6S145_9AGAR|nr:G-protein subunit alpha 7 [Mycena indigotica]KAF7291380.1 G-protein subunit alpha 7 [Mycena indigotica]